MLRVGPSILCTSRHILRPIAATRNFGTGNEQLPESVQTFFHYASEAYITKGIQTGIEGKLIILKVFM
jgi:hypothetical protein